jgi:SET domain-containing protein
MSQYLTEKQKQLFQIKKTSYGLGLFAKKNIAKGTYLVEYGGEKISNEEGERRSGRYLMIYDDNFMLDGKSRSNIGRYVNHACKPNCTTYFENKKIRFYSIKNIKAGEELTFDYGKEYFDAYIKPFGCRCTSCLKNTM